MPIFYKPNVILSADSLFVIITHSHKMATKREGTELRKKKNYIFAHNIDDKASYFFIITSTETVSNNAQKHVEVL